MTCHRQKRNKITGFAAVLLSIAVVFCCMAAPVQAEKNAVTSPQPPVSQGTVSKPAVVSHPTVSVKPASSAPAAPSVQPKPSSAPSRAPVSHAAPSRQTVSRAAYSAPTAVSSQAVVSVPGSKASSASVSSKSSSSAVSRAAGGILLPSVGSVSEKSLFSNPADMTAHNSTIDGVGIALWAVIAGAGVFVFILVYRNRKHARRETVGQKRYSSVRRDKKKRLLGDKYYKDSKYNNKDL